MFGVYIAGGISGGHLNPAVTLTNCILRKFPWRKFPIYMFAQTLGCFVGSAIIYANYKSAFDQFEFGTVHIYDFAKVQGSRHTDSRARNQYRSRLLHLSARDHVWGITADYLERRS